MSIENYGEKLPDVSSKGNDKDDHVVHGATDAEGLGMVV
jgi:hypothetical protein